ncbi:LINE-1 reverse transcriptase like [Trifolium medium]|uniref:LINE-1 reverse transcriptase like n=1 Tax=Trifolium medium TaxID=97028 RepID=A0A392LXZ4_9FABA|nr:LINE-1 reverse transcriptase like [Trifolium medium]
MGFVLKEKLRGVKDRLKEWNKVEYGNIEERVKKIVEDILALDMRGENLGLTAQEVDLRKQLFDEFWKLKKSQEANIVQRSRSKWLSHGDVNSSFFHRCMSARKNRNTISALKIGDIWVETPTQIRREVENFFSNHFMSMDSIRPNLDGIPFPSLSVDENRSLTVPFSMDEIHLVVKESDGNKSPGPDGFNFAFIKHCWDILKGEIRIMFDQFHGIGRLPKGLLAYFVTLIPKLVKVMNSLIASNQSAFIKGRNLVDGVLVVNEVVDLARRSRVCVWGSLSVLVNGCPTGEINIQRGLKQGDPLAPFLFLLVAEGFGGAMRRAVDINLFKGFRVGSGGPIISHLQYADDTLCIGEASVDNLWTLKAILRGFELASGLKVNFLKSCLMGINAGEEVMETACTFLNCIKGSFPFKYLGLMVGANPRRVATWVPVLTSLRKRLNSWGNKNISFGGRLVLINSVLNSLPIFYLSYMKMPAQVIKKVIRIQREFLWGGVNGGKKISWIKWRVVCQHKNNGGLGVRDVKAVNLSLLMKWRWRLLNSLDRGLWKEVLVAKYGGFIVNNVGLANWPPSRYASLWWKDIWDLETCVESKNWIVDNISRSLGNGRGTRFWCDKWIGESLLSVKFPGLFLLSLQKEATVNELLEVEDDSRVWKFAWRRRLYTWEEEDVGRLQTYLANVTMSLEEDKWRWDLDPDGGFSVSSAYEDISKELVLGPTLSHFEAAMFKHLWKSPAPSKVIAFSWRLFYDRVPTKDNLCLRGILPTSGGGCIWCGIESEMSSHLFLHCKVALEVWYEIFKWLGVVIVVPPNIMCLFACLSEAEKSNKVKKGFRLVWHTSIWLIWKARNDFIFNNVGTNSSELVEAIKVLSWKWSADRLKIPPCLYYEWTWDPSNCFVR